MSDLPPHYSPYIIANNLLITSGQLPLIDRATKQSADGIKAQTLLVLQKVERLIKQEGLTKNNIIKTTAYITNINDWGAVNEVYVEFFGDHKPARSIIPVSDLHFGCLIELEAMVAIPQD